MTRWGVCIEPPEYVIGLRPFEHWVLRTQPEGMPSGPGDLDLTIYGLRKFCRLAMKGSPTVLLLLFADGDEQIVVREPLGEALQGLAPAFVSRRAGRAFLGYLDAQRRGLLGDRHATRTRERSSAHGYDTKYAMHALRIAPGHRADHDGPDQPARAGAGAERAAGRPPRRAPLAGVVGELHARSAELEQALLASSLPDEADREAIDAFLVRGLRGGLAPLTRRRSPHSP